MEKLNLANPKMMDVAVPANLKIGLSQDEVEAKGWGLSCASALPLVNSADAVLIDLRDGAERKRNGVIPGSVHAPYPELTDNIRRGGLLNELATATGKRLVFYCAFGERSAMAVQAAQEAGLTNCCHISGGIDSWRKAGAPIEGGSPPGSSRENTR